MPLNEKNIVSIILTETKKVPERCQGYKEELLGAITDIIQAERLHRVHGTNIQQKVTDKVNATGQYLARKRGQIDGEEGE